MRTWWIVAAVAALAGGVGLAPEARAAGWKAGTAKVAITPSKPMWMAGYGARDKPSQGTVHDLWAKALVLEDPNGTRAIVVTLDVCGIDRGTSRNIRDSFRAEYGVGDDRIVIACSHTHCGPVIGTNLITMYKIDDAQRELIAEYTGILQNQIKGAVRTAMDRLGAADLAWESGRADFAVNRRENVEANVPELRKKSALLGPVDHDVPVLRVKDADGKVKAVLFGYACHCTVLGIFEFCGDYAGFAQIALEKAYPDSQAMFVAGCGADQNPLPRRTIELAEAYGNQLADAVGRVVAQPMRPVSGPLRSHYEEIPLKLGKLPTPAELELTADKGNFYEASRAKMLLGKIRRDGKLAQEYPYPIEVWKLGELTWVFLGGEVVVDYSLRLKRNLGSSKTFVSGYCNDVMAYIPNLRVLREGRYEGDTSMIYYGLPTKWSEDVEEQIIDAVTRLNNALAESK